MRTKKRVAVLGAVVFSMVAIAGCQSEAKRVQEQGKRAWANNDLDMAISCFSEAIRLDPKNASSYYCRGLAYWEKHKYDRAIADYTEVIRLDPKAAEAYRGRAMAYGNRGKGEYDEVIADYTEAIRLDPKDAEAYSGRAMAYGNKGDHDKAIADYSEAIRLTQKTPMHTAYAAGPTVRTRLRQGDCRLHRGHPPRPKERLCIRRTRRGLP